MKQTALAEMKQETRMAKKPLQAQLDNRMIEPERMLLCLPDVAVLDKRGSNTGLYQNKDGRIMPLEDLSGYDGDVLVRANGKLQNWEKKALSMQGTARIYVRETMNGGCHVVRAETEERYANLEPNGTVVIEYLVLNKIQAQRLLDDGGMVELKERKPAEYPNQMNSLEAAGIVMYHALYGGC
jgi:hypothetical protein